MVYCCVANCGNNSRENYRFFSFPKTEYMDLWIAKVGRVDLFCKRRELVRRNFYVCSEHFSAEQLKATYYQRCPLKPTAYPDKKLPYETDPSIPIFCEPLNVHQYKPNIEFAAESSDFPDQDCDFKTELPSPTNYDAPIRPSAIQPVQIDMIMEQSNDFHAQETVNSESESIKKSYADIDKLIEKGRDQLEYNPCCYALLKKAHAINRDYQCLKKQLSSLATQLDDLLSNMDPVMADHIVSELNQQGKGPEGRSFSRDMKLFCFTVMKCSPKLYSVLENRFGLPSYTSMMDDT